MSSPATDRDTIIIDATMLMVAETILKIADNIEAKVIPDMGTVVSMRSLAKSLVNSVEEVR